LEDNVEKVKSLLSGVDSTKIFFTDLNGRTRGVSINPDNIEKITEKGIGFDGSSIDGITTVDDSDRLLFPVEHSLRIVEFNDKRLGFFIGRIDSEKGTSSDSDPRAVLVNVIDTAEKEFGCRFLVGPEYEFFLLKGDEFPEARHTDRAGYFSSDPYDRGDVVRENIVEILRKCGITFEKDHHEVTPSQHEINFECTTPIEAADQTLLFMHVARKVAAANGYFATFMPKPFNGQNRSAFHMHLSMQDIEGKNMFYDENKKNNLSDAARFFTGGILKYARETSIIMASTYNSYKAYTVEKEAPIACGWGLRNRSSMIRVPYASDPSGTRIELRSPDPSGNVYLQMAVFIAMGLQGMRDSIDPGEPDTGSVYKRRDYSRIKDTRLLPRSMYEALAEAEKSEFLRGLLGERLFASYLELKTREWENFRTAVTTLEHAAYLSI